MTGTEAELEELVEELEESQGEILNILEDPDLHDSAKLDEIYRLLEEE